MAYKPRPDGNFRMRASFAIKRDHVIGLNTICEATGLPLSELCGIAIGHLVAHYVQGGQFLASGPLAIDPPVFAGPGKDSTFGRVLETRFGLSR